MSSQINPGDTGSPDAAELPLVSVVMANYRGAAHLEAALRSVLAQTHRRLELLLADDASDDDSLAVAAAIDDPRLRILPSERNRGPAATRNRALQAARGDWIAIVDSDDLIHPQRLERLLSVARARGADIVADDLVHFGAPSTVGGATLLQPLALTEPMPLDVATFLSGLSGKPMAPVFGYLKPLISRAVLGTRLYDETLHIGEDNDLIVRLLMAGARFTLVPDPLYAYRRHAGSTSHRLSVETMTAMLAAHRALPRMTDPAAARMIAEVDRNLRRDMRYEWLVRDLKDRRLARALPRLADPAMVRRLAASLIDRRRRKAARTHAVEAAAAPVSCPEMPPPGRPWATPPAPAAAFIGYEASAGRPVPLPDLPGWAAWLEAAIRA